MSYSRKGKDSDIYLIGTGDGYECLGCPLAEMETYSTSQFIKDTNQKWEEEVPHSFTFKMRGSVYMRTAEEALRHLQTHNSHGHKFNAGALERLRKEVQKDKDST